MARRRPATARVRTVTARLRFRRATTLRLPPAAIPRTRSSNPTALRLPAASASSTVSGDMFTGSLAAKPYREPPPSVTTGRFDNGAVRFERPSNDLMPLRRFNGPKYPPNSDGGPKSEGDRSIGTFVFPARPSGQALVPLQRATLKRSAAGGNRPNSPHPQFFEPFPEIGLIAGEALHGLGHSAKAAT